MSVPTYGAGGPTVAQGTTGAAAASSTSANPLPTAVVTALGIYATDPRWLRIRPESGGPAGTEVPAMLAGGLTLVLGVGARVRYSRVGLRLVVTGAV